MLTEINFDGIIGPSHNYAGLSLGNLASAKNAGGTSQPRAAALQGVEKMRANLRLGLTQGFFMPQDRPDTAWLGNITYHLNAAGLALPCGPHRPACPPRRRLVHVGLNRPLSVSRRAAHGHREAAAESGARGSHQPRQPICQPQLSPGAADRGYRPQHEQQGQLLEQRTGRKLLRNPQGRGAPALRIQHPRRGPRQSPAVHLLVQRPPPALDPWPAIPCYLRSSNPNRHLRCLTP